MDIRPLLVGPQAVERAPASVLIIGNGHVENAEAMARQADFVIRLDGCLSFANCAGRTDVVAVCNTGKPARELLGSNSWRNHEPVLSAGEFWCVRDPRKMRSIRPMLAAVYPELNDFCHDSTAEFHRFCKEHGKRCHIIDEAVHDMVDEELFAVGTDPYVVPSSGMIVVASALETFPTSQITVIGFSYEGWKWHPYTAERKLLEHYALSGRITRA